jgi:hypothetical protein
MTAENRRSQDEFDLGLYAALMPDERVSSERRQSKNKAEAAGVGCFRESCVAAKEL